MEEYDKLWRIGTGGQGKVHRVRHRRTNKELALKQILCRDNYEMNFALHEIKVLTQIKHQYIISFHDFFIHKDRYQQIAICLVMELCECGDLSDRIKDARRRRIRFEEPKIVKWTNQINFALNYLHEQDYIHRDVKPTNIFFTNDESVRLGDFGLSRRSEKAERKTVVGTPYYFAPELMLHQRYTNKVDIWGVGVVVLELCTLRERPINSQVLQGPQVLADAEAEVVGKGYTQRLAQLCRSMMARDPHQRPTARDVLRKWASEADLERFGVVAAAPARPRSRSGGPGPHLAAAQAAVTGRAAPRGAQEDEERDALRRQLAARDDEVRQLKQELERMRRVNSDRALGEAKGKDRDARGNRLPLGDLGDYRNAAAAQALAKEAIVKEAAPPAPRDRPAVITPAFQQQQQQQQGGRPLPAPPGRPPQTHRPAATAVEADPPAPERAPGAAATARAAGRNEKAAANGAGVPPAVPRAAFTAIDDPSSLLADLTGSSTEASGDEAAPLPRRQDTQPHPVEGEPAPEKRVRNGESIQAAVDATPVGGTVSIEPGTYCMPVSVTKAITLSAADPKDRPVIEVCNKTAITVSAAVRLHGLVIKQRKLSEGLEGKWVACDFRQGSIGASLTNCDLSSEGGACVTVHKNAEPTIRHCTIHDGAQAGVYMFDGARGLVEHNNIHNNTYAALLLKRGADPIVRHNRIHSGRDTGVFICHESKGTIEDNEIFANGGSGVVVKGGGVPSIVRNSIHSNKQAGVFVCDRGGGVIRDNDIARNLKAGVLIKTHATPLVEKNKIHSGKETGVYCFEHGKGTVTDNIISGNQNAGVLITTGGRLVVKANVIKDNRYEGVWICNDGGGTIMHNDLRGNSKGAMDIDNGCQENVSVADNQV